MKFESIQYIRAAAALMVVGSHALGYAAGSGLPFDPNPVLLGGVDIFFVISGVVMWVSTCDRPIGPAAFYRARLVRIVPLYWLVTSVLVACMLAAPSLLHTGRFDIGHVLASYAFVAWPHPTTHLMFPVLIPGWTLNYEMFFYLAFGLLLLLPARRRIPALVAGGVALCGWHFAWRDAGPVAGFYTDPILLEFVAGTCLAAWLTQGGAKSAIGSLILFGTGLALCAILPLACGPGAPRVLVNGVPALLLVGGAVSAERRLGLFRSRLLGNLGDASYSIYLIHPIVLAALVHLWTSLRLDPAQHRLMFFVNAFALVAAAGLVLHGLIERPLLALTHRIGRRDRGLRPIPMATALPAGGRS